MVVQDFTASTKELIDSLKSVCGNYGLGNDGNEFKIITQAFLYKFMNDKFAHEIKKELSSSQKDTDNWESVIAKMPDKEYDFLLRKIKVGNAKLKREHYLSFLFNRQNSDKFSKLFDDTLIEIAALNADIFSVKTGTGAKIVLFDELSVHRR